MLNVARYLKARPGRGEWLSVAQAAQVTELSRRMWQRYALNETRNAKRESREPLAVKAPPASDGGKRIWWINKTLVDRVQVVVDESAASAFGKKYPPHVVEETLAKHRLLMEWRRLCDEPRTGNETERVRAERVVSKAKKGDRRWFLLTPRTLQAWWSRYKAVGPHGKVRGVEGLIDRRGLRKADGCTTRSPQAIAYFLELVGDGSRMSLTRCHKTTMEEARKHGWAWSASLSATLQWFGRHGRKADTSACKRGVETPQGKVG